MKALTSEQLNAVLAGLRLLQRAIASAGPDGLEASDLAIFEIAAEGSDDMITADGIDELCAALQGPAERHSFELANQDDRDEPGIQCSVTEAACGSLLIAFPGYKDYVSDPGEGWPVLIDHIGGHPRVVVWGDINQKGPTHIISLEHAAESNRKADSP